MEYLKKISTGEFGLKKTFWIFNFWSGLLVTFLLVTIDSSFRRNASGPITIILIVYLPLLWMITIGVWNSVKEYKGDVFHAHIARAISSIFFIVMAITAIGNAIMTLKN